MNLGRLSENWHIWILLILVITGLALQWLDIFDWQTLLAWLKDHTQSGWLIVLLVLAQIVLYMFALPGSALLWIVAPLFPSMPAILILVSGSSLGALAAYWLARNAQSSKLEQLRKHSAFKTVQKQSDFITLLALRVFPSFPHSLINYSAGILHIPLLRFIASTVVGFTIKVYLYTNAIHGITELSEPSQLADIKVIAPLLALAILAILTKVLRHFWLGKKSQ